MVKLIDNINLYHNETVMQNAASSKCNEVYASNTQVHNTPSLYFYYCTIVTSLLHVRVANKVFGKARTYCLFCSNGQSSLVNS